MGKYICPYCAETDKFIIDTEIDEESGATYDERVRCGNCYKLFTDDLYREFAANNKLGTKDLNNIGDMKRVQRSIQTTGKRCSLQNIIELPIVLR